MPSLKELESWMSTGQVSKKLKRSRQGVINLAENRKLRAVKIAGEFWAYDPESVEDFAHKEEIKKQEQERTAQERATKRASKDG
jgi:hypothetical protein